MRIYLLAILAGSISKRGKLIMTKTDWEKAVEFHGHACPGLAIGFKAG